MNSVSGDISSLLEVGANIGLNLRALHQLLPEALLSGIEINPDAAQTLREWLSGVDNDGWVFEGSILDWSPEKPVDLAFTKGVLIHISPDHLSVVYDKLYQASKRYILVSEYYNPTPMAVPYRGHSDRLFKRDFAGEMLDLYPDLKLIDYGFVYKRDPLFPLDDETWFLLEKR
ncbi:pseudaminic acid biosynthesis-associated methylase [Thiohalospira halophila]|uniref:pseudaminic acid biosynthesis-associated methylase n=1 Tax=Thiohalospira halophila TaxID=381300 RepID=UPI0019682611|nr:pseudaminic acid biosynthesis-associated methylase [Thiohalospira halophila]